MVGQLDLHRPLQQPLRQLGEHAAGPNELLFRARAGEQLVDQLVRQLLTQPRTRALAATPRGAGDSPCGDPPAPAWDKEGS